MRDLSAAVGDPSRFVLADEPSPLRVRDAMTSSLCIDSDQHLVGIVSYVDALRAFASDHPRA